MEYTPFEKHDQKEYTQSIPDPHKKKPTVQSEPSIIDKCQKLIKCVYVKENTISSNKSPRPVTSIIYPINQTWIFWYRDPTKMHGKNPWEESLTKIETVRDITHLWKVLNHVIQPSLKSLHRSLFVFNEKSIPAWEHKSNENAGRWVITLNDNNNLHNVWNNMVLQVIGDKFSNVVADINGIGVHVKPVFSKITIWTVEITLDNYKNINEIGIMCRTIIGPMVKYINYVMHNQDRST